MLGQKVQIDYKVTGPFNDEAIAGGFIQDFSLFLFYTISVFVVTKKTNLKIYLLSLIFNYNSFNYLLWQQNAVNFFLLSIILILFTNKTLKIFLQIFIF